YPSVLMINQERARAVIKLEQDAEVNGLIILTGDDDNYYQRVLSMVDGAHVNGMLYVNGMLTHFGELNGHATVRKFLINSFSGVYENYFMNGTMKAELDSAFVLPNTWHVKTEKEVMQWLD
ncbi:MAG: hypothetical protein KI790_21570, partial [Cyclobacteriaceae bacterium]|nr:hypothetical protein [Cyclobacteriaceae bacterium HetDA_MAG_MS6]